MDTTSRGGTAVTIAEPTPSTNPDYTPPPVIPDPNPNPEPAPIIPDPDPNPEPAPVIPNPEPAGT